MDKDRFAEHLMVFGADIRRWPEEIRSEALDSLDASPELRILTQEQLRFEEGLDTVPFEEPDGSLPQRIITAALGRGGPESPGLVPSIVQWFADFHLPRPALTAAVLLFIGMTIGFLTPIDTVATEQDDPVLQEFLYDDGEDL